MQFSDHAIVRGQQRGISGNMVDLILFYGNHQKRPGNVLEYRIGRKEIIGGIS
jgi:hypothetical protein